MVMALVIIGIALIALPTIVRPATKHMNGTWMVLIISTGLFGLSLLTA